MNLSFPLFLSLFLSLFFSLSLCQDPFSSFSSPLSSPSCFEGVVNEKERRERRERRVKKNLENDPSFWFGGFQDDFLDGEPLCTIPRVEGCVSNDLFVENFTSFPIVLVDCVDNSLFQFATQRERLLSQYGEASVLLSSANTFSHDKRRTTLKDYLNNMMREKQIKDSPSDGEKIEDASKEWYFFGDNDHQEWEEIFKLYRAPPYLEAEHSTGVSFGIGKSGSGVPFHIHGPAFAEVLHGRKRWFLSAPEIPIEFDPDITSLSWFLNKYPSLKDNMKPLDCTLGPGEILFIPTNWYHATLNIGETVFLSVFV